MVADHAEREEDGSPEIVSSGNILGSFTESKQTQDLIVNLQMSCMEPVSREVCAQSFKVIMDNYQEQPHLLDPHLGWMLELLLDIIQDKSSSPDFFQLAITFLLIISKMSQHQVDFLDVTIKVQEDGSLTSDLYHKPMNYNRDFWTVDSQEDC
ncbi:tubulin-specific chaperone D-like isoform X2 [Hyperolius riggenbachi]|uniref:tubulin-specific chaperone D-like isoform X2 n=1 Tax=Hyperolius riggenbachi TaxID=752182 RepID=UPI0035A37326